MTTLPKIDAADALAQAYRQVAEQTAEAERAWFAQAPTKKAGESKAAWHRYGIWAGSRMAQETLKAAMQAAGLETN
jgi:hypothetical protein